MNSRFFVFLYVEDHKLSNLINTAIVALDPSERWPAHITLAGPYPNRRSTPRNLEFSRRVSVIGVDQFRSEFQNTVYLTVGARDMRDVWRKPDYPYKPHLTIYNGSNHELGDELFKQLKTHRPIFKFDVSKLYVVESGAQRDFNLMSQIDLSFSPIIENMSVTDFRHIDDDMRIKIAVECIKKAVLYSANIK
jgi:hypothetical protein